MKTDKRYSEGHLASRLTESEFNHFREMIFDWAGISIGPAKKALVAGRLQKRLCHYGMQNYSEYIDILKDGKNVDECHIMVDLLTTNETYFFREPKHFDVLSNIVLPSMPADRVMRVWSAASSSGEEAYSIAMLLAEHIGLSRMEILGTDISRQILEKARRGQYPDTAAAKIPGPLKHKYCLNGVRSKAGFFLINKRLRERVSFQYMNLNGTWPGVGEFDVIFLRNVMIYFDMETKKKLVSRVIAHLRKGGYFFIGHSESLHGLTDEVRMIKPSMYRKD